MIPSKNKSKIADKLAILEAEIISYLTNLLGNPTAYGYGRKVKITKRTVYKDTERVQIMTSITTSLLYPKIIYHKQFLTEDSVVSR